jgi:hypothetical protein
LSTKNTLQFVPPDLRGFEIYPKLTEMMDYIVSGFEEQFGDVVNKYANPADASEDVVARVIDEYGFRYIYEIAVDLNNVDVSILLNFMSLLHFMKGTRAGLELVLEVLGFSSNIVEWWETEPRGEEHTFDMTVFMDLSQVTDVFATLARVKTFAENYVYPRFNVATVVFAFEFSAAATAFAGFVTQAASSGVIEGTI